MRSGTTILAQALASAPGALLIGELRPILSDSAHHNVCDCGEPAQLCPFWSKVPTSYENGSLAELDAAYSLRNIFRTLATATSNRRKPFCGLKIAAFLGRLESVRSQAVLVDSTKTPVGVLLWRAAGVRPHVVHIVRDPREVAKKQSQPSAQSQLERHSAVRTWLEWIVYTFMAYLVGASPLVSSYSLVGFSDFTQSPAEALARISGRCGLQIPTPVDGTFVVTESHMRAGNPRRETRSVRIAEAG